MKSRHGIYLLTILLFALYLAPYVPFLSLWESWEVPWSKIFEIYAASTQQALWSVAFTCAAGALTTGGLLWFRRRFGGRGLVFMEYMVALPSLLPSLFVIISVLSVIPKFPFGLKGVVLLHAISMMGFTGVLFFRLIDDKWGSHSLMAQVLGAKGFYFFRRMFPLIARDVMLILSVLFFYFLTSISIPLIIGGSAFTSVEKTIYDQLAVVHDPNKAIQYFLLQSLFLIPTFAFAQSYSSRSGTLTETMRMGASGIGFLISLVPPMILLMGLMLRLIPGLRAMTTYPEFFRSLPIVLTGSLLLGFLAGGICSLLLAVWTLLNLKYSTRRMLKVLCVPSVSVVAFGFSLWSVEGEGAFVFAALALAVIFVPVLFRLGIYQRLLYLQTQIDSARQMGATTWFLFRRVVWPQICPTLFMLSGLCAVWAMSDFAVSRLILERDWSLGLWIQSLVQQYRWDVAVAGCWLLILCGFLVFLFFWSVARVSGQKLK